MKGLLLPALLLQAVTSSIFKLSSSCWFRLSCRHDPSTGSEGDRELVDTKSAPDWRYRALLGWDVVGVVKNYWRYGHWVLGDEVPEAGALGRA